MILTEIKSINNSAKLTTHMMDYMNTHLFFIALIPAVVITINILPKNHSIENQCYLIVKFVIRLVTFIAYSILIFNVFAITKTGLS